MANFGVKRDIDYETGAVKVQVFKGGKVVRTFTTAPQENLKRPYFDLTITSTVNGRGISSKDIDPSTGGQQLLELGEIMKQASRHINNVDYFFRQRVAPVVMSRIRSRFEGSFFSESFGWAPWAPLTWKIRTNSGQKPPGPIDADQTGFILVNTGGLKNSVNWTVHDFGEGADIEFFSDHPHAEELQGGDDAANLPARPFMGLVAKATFMGQTTQAVDTTLIAMVNERVATWMDRCLGKPFESKTADPVTDPGGFDTSFDFGANVASSNPPISSYDQGELPF